MALLYTRVSIAASLSVKVGYQVNDCMEPIFKYTLFKERENGISIL